jgi:hypothetical protein
VTEELVPMPVEREPLKEPSDVEEPIAAAPREYLHAVVEALHTPAGLPTLEVVRISSIHRSSVPRRLSNSASPL